MEREPTVRTTPLVAPNVSECIDMLPARTILAGWWGSLAHGTYIPSSDPMGTDDWDVLAVHVAPLEHYLGLGMFTQRKAQVIIHRDPWDITSYELQKFVHLLLGSNPNVMSLLWLPEEKYIVVTEEGLELIGSRDIFVTKQVYHSFVGYAFSQLRRLEGGAHRGYMGEKRKRMVERFGYDVKNASTLIRLLRMGTEFLETGVLRVCRPDADELKAIKRGEWTLQQVKTEADRWFDRAARAYVTSDLPEEPDRESAVELVKRILMRRHRLVQREEEYGRHL